MPEISRFFGISIKMFYGDHVPPHFHVEYAEYKGVVDIVLHTWCGLTGFFRSMLAG